MKQGLRISAALLLAAILILSQAGHVQGTITATADIPNHKVNFATDNLTFYFWYGPPQFVVYINPTFAWLNNKQPSVLYVVDLMGLFEFKSSSSDNAFQRNQTARNGTFSWIGNEAWSSNNKTYSTPISYNYLNLTLNSITRTQAKNFSYLPGNVTFGPTNYGTSSNQNFFKYGYSASQSRTDVFFNMTRWKWTANATTSNLALMFGFYALNMTVIQRLGINLEQYVVPDFNFISPEELKPRYAPFDPSAFLLTGMNLTASNGATTSGGLYDLTRNETTTLPTTNEHPIRYTLPNPSGTTKMPFIKLQFASGNSTLPGYFSFPGYAFGLNSTSSKIDTFNVAASYISTGNFARVFLSYPYFNLDHLRDFFSFGVDDNYLPAPPTPSGVYIVLPSLPYQQALIIAGMAIISIVVAVYATRIARKEA